MKMQSYTSFDLFASKAKSHWLIEEPMNSFFWEFANNKESRASIKWMGSVFDKGFVVGSVILTGSSYILISSCDELVALRISKYLKEKRMKIKGILGPKKQTDFFCDHCINSLGFKSFHLKKKFLVMERETTCNFQDDQTKLSMATQREWPRLWLWAKSFANEMVPELDSAKTVGMAKRLLKSGDLFILKTLSGQTIAMGGFGRTTSNYLVINMVYVCPECRHQGTAGRLVKKLLNLSQKRGYSRCLLFTDYFSNRNLYSKVGFRKRGYVEESQFV